MSSSFFWEERFAQSNGPLHPRVKDLLERFTRCGDFHFWFLRLACLNPECRSRGKLLVPHSCKVRGLCPSCGQRRAIEWAERLVEAVLPRVPYRQLVFTIPRRLRRSFLFERSLYGELSRAAYASTRDFLRRNAPAGSPRLKKAAPAMVVSPQSFGDLLIAHPHVHAVVSLGIFSQDGRFAPMEDLDFCGLEEIFRERVFEMMIKRGKITPQIAEDMRLWPHSGFHLNWEPAQDDVIEKILRQLDRWDPPWKRLRKARGPPASRPAPSAAAPEVFDPGPDVDQYCRDPPPVDD